ncbi:MAG: putative porin, partial [Bacteroidota bacterium]
QIVNKDTLLPNYYGVKAFLSRVGNLIYYSDSMEVRQAGDGQALTWIGVEARMRQNVLRHFYLESSVAVQNGSVEGDVPLQLYAESIPEFYGSASLYFERSNIKIAKRLRIGVELEYNNSFAGQTVDPISGEFFPTPYLIPDYPRVHAFFVLHPPRSNTYVWFRFQHINEQLPYLGYYTTPFYPMLERTFSFGASWTFYD